MTFAEFCLILGGETVIWLVARSQNRDPLVPMVLYGVVIVILLTTL